MENTAADATDTPVIAAKIAFAITVAAPTPPLTRRNRDSAASNRSRVAPDCVANNPITTNSGMTANT